MKTVVLQSFRTTNVPPWIPRCLARARAWSEARGYDYRFLDDSFFDYSPAWYRERVSGQVQLVSDLARLYLARELLGQGYARAIWLDADLLIFAPERFETDIAEEYAFCREAWVGGAGENKIGLKPGVNNSVSVYVRGNSMLDFYIHACEQTIRKRSELSNLSVGTRLLTTLHRLLDFPLLQDVGLFSPLILQEIDRDGSVFLPALVAQHASPIHAVNLCLSLNGRRIDGVQVDDGLFDRVIARLERSGGDCVNRYHVPKGDPAAKA